MSSPQSRKSIKELEAISSATRKIILETLAEAKSGHPGGSLSAVEILVTLYYDVLRHDPKNPSWPDRDRFILSKGHAAPLLYSILAQQGYFPIEELKTLRKINSMLQGHPDTKKTPGVEMCAGSEGVGLSFGIGEALAARIDKKDYRVYVMMGDGEMQEGQIWEAAMCASKYGLDNITGIVDRNGIQQDGLTEQIMPIEPLSAKWKSFNWNVIEVDGYDFEQITGAFARAKQVRNRPTVIIAHTTKGKGVEFMEWAPEYHGKVPDKETVSKIIREMK
ncbi:MAG: transketolase [Nitrososphaerota archaeon]|jgi:transketolase|nr:transketolase [Nitrososphaerota archaeon]